MQFTGWRNQWLILLQDIAVESARELWQKNHHAICCEGRDQWIHIKCGTVTTKKYKQLITLQSFTWQCPRCVIGQKDQSTSTQEGDINPARPDGEQQRTRLRNLSVMSLNVNSLVSTEKRDSFLALLDTHQPDTIRGCESKFCPEIGSNKAIPTNKYEEHRNDNKKSKGGVFFSCQTQSCIDVQSGTICADINCELVWVSVKLWKQEPVYIGLFFRLPNPKLDHTNILQQLVASLQRLTSRQKLPHIVLARHFSLPDNDWESGEVRSPSIYPVALNEQALDVADDNYLCQFTAKPTRYDNILDLVLSSQPDKINNL